MLGAATLIMAISSWAVLLPTLSIMSAAFRHSSRFISISVPAGRCVLAVEPIPKQKGYPSNSSRVPDHLGLADGGLRDDRPGTGLADLRACPSTKQMPPRIWRVYHQHPGMAVERVVKAWSAEGFNRNVFRMGSTRSPTVCVRPWVGVARDGGLQQ